MFESDNAEEAGEILETTETTNDEGSTGETQVVDTTPVVDEDPLYEVTVQGKKLKLPLSEIRNGYQRNRDYTQKTMELSEMRKAWEREKAEITNKTEELRKWMSDPQNLKQYYDYLVQQQGFETPDQPMTAAQVQQMLAKERTAQQAQVKAMLDHERNEMTTKQQAAAISQEISGTIKGLLESHSELQSVDGIEALLYKDVASQHPDSVEEAKRLFAEAAAKRAEKLRTTFMEQQKRSAVDAEKLKKGIQPPGGTGVVSTSQPKFKLGSMDLRNAVLADITAGKEI